MRYFVLKTNNNFDRLPIHWKLILLLILTTGIHHGVAQVNIKTEINGKTQLIKNGKKG